MTEFTKKQKEEMRAQRFNPDQYLRLFSPRLQKSIRDNFARDYSQHVELLKKIRGGSSSEKQWLIYSGPTGSGKTTTAGRLLIEQIRLRIIHPEGPGITSYRFITANDFADLCRSAIEDPESSIKLDEIKTSPFLVFDDLGNSRATEYADDKIQGLLEYRYEFMLPTIMTTNIENIEQELNARLVSRINDAAILVKMKRKD